MSAAAAILFAQWKTLRNRGGRTGSRAWARIASSIWYGAWLLVAIVVAKIVAEPGSARIVGALLPPAFLMAMLYWQLIPLLMTATGASLEIRKLRAYPIPETHLFWIEAMLRVTSGVEMILALGGVATGAFLNPEYPKWAPLAIAGFIVFNLLFAIGMRDLAIRVLARKKVREAGFFFLALCAALPQLMFMRAPATARMLKTLGSESWWGWPWSATARLMQGDFVLQSAAVLLFWIGWATLFGRWQFSRSLAFDASESPAPDREGTARAGLMEAFYRLPSALLPDPFGVLIEKDFRSLLRSARFRLVFLMGFTFGLMIWLPMALGYGGHRLGASAVGGLPFVAHNYLTVVSVYSLLLLSDTCFWNVFGFDRNAAQFYFLAPVSFMRVMLAKNVTSVFFVGAEISAVMLVCAALGLPVSATSLAEAIAVAVVATLFLLSAGNVQSIRSARGVNPANSFRAATAGRVQATLLLVYPLIFAPIALAFLARYAFDSEAAFFAVLAVDTVIAVVVYWSTLESSVDTAEKTKESLVAALSVSDGPIAA